MIGLNQNTDEALKKYEGRRIFDYRAQGWGWGIYKWQISDDLEFCEVEGFSPGMQVGDIMVIHVPKSARGRKNYIMEVATVRYWDKPDDYFVAVVKHVETVRETEAVPQGR